MKVDLDKLKKEYNLVSSLLEKQKKERKEILKEVKLLTSVWRKEWGWDEEVFFIDCEDGFDDFVSELKNRWQE